MLKAVFFNVRKILNKERTRRRKKKEKKTEKKRRCVSGSTQCPDEVKITPLERKVSSISPQKATVCRC